MQIRKDSSLIFNSTHRRKSRKFHPTLNKQSYIWMNYLMAIFLKRKIKIRRHLNLMKNIRMILMMMCSIFNLNNLTKIMTMITVWRELTIILISHSSFMNHKITLRINRLIEKINRTFCKSMSVVKSSLLGMTCSHK